MVGTDNPARARNRALRAGGASQNTGERCSGDAFAGCSASVVGFPVTFVKTGAAKGAPAVVRVAFVVADPAAAAVEVLDALGGAAASGLSVSAAGAAGGPLQPG